MLKWALMLSVLASAAQAATYRFEDHDGDFLVRGIGGRADFLAIYEEEVTNNQLAYESCLAFEPDANCTQELNDFSDSLANGAFANFEEYHAAQIEAAAERRMVYGWQTNGLLLTVGGYSLFPYGPWDSFLGGIETPGDGVGPRSVEFTLLNDDVFQSIDLFMGHLDLEDAIYITSGDHTRTLNSNFSGTYVFDDAVRGARSFRIETGVSDMQGIFGMGYDNLVTVPQLMAEVPLPGSLPAMGLGLGALAALRRRRKRRTT